MSEIIQEAPKPTMEEEQNEREVEPLMAPLRELTNCNVFRYTNLWQVTVEWKEPELDLDNRPILGEWEKFSAQGPLNQQFLDWAEGHFRYWANKALVPLNVTEVKLLKENDPRRETVSW